MAKKRKKNPRSEIAKVRCTPREKQAWQDAAEASESGQFSDWARDILNAAARDAVERGHRNDGG